MVQDRVVHCVALGEDDGDPPEKAGQRVLFMAANMLPAKSAGRSESYSTKVVKGTDVNVGSGAYAATTMVSQLLRASVQGVQESPAREALQGSVGKFDEGL